jgi:hypothetical protein
MKLSCELAYVDRGRANGQNNNLGREEIGTQRRLETSKRLLQVQLWSNEHDIADLG